MEGLSSMLGGMVGVQLKEFRAEYDLEYRWSCFTCKGSAELVSADDGQTLRWKDAKGSCLPAVLKVDAPRHDTNMHWFAVPDDGGIWALTEPGQPIKLFGSADDVKEQAVPTVMAMKREGTEKKDLKKGQSFLTRGISSARLGGIRAGGLDGEKVAPKKKKQTLREQLQAENRQEKDFKEQQKLDEAEAKKKALAEEAGFLVNAGGGRSEDAKFSPPAKFDAMAA